MRGTRKATRCAGVCCAKLFHSTTSKEIEAKRGGSCCRPLTQKRFKEKYSQPSRGKQPVERQRNRISKFVNEQIGQRERAQKYDSQMPQPSQDAIKPKAAMVTRLDYNAARFLRCQPKFSRRAWARGALSGASFVRGHLAGPTSPEIDYHF